MASTGPIPKGSPGRGGRGATSWRAGVRTRGRGTIPARLRVSSSSSRERCGRSQWRCLAVAGAGRHRGRGRKPRGCRRMRPRRPGAGARLCAGGVRCRAGGSRGRDADHQGSVVCEGSEQCRPARVRTGLQPDSVVGGRVGGLDLGARRGERAVCAARGPTGVTSKKSTMLPSGPTPGRCESFRVAQPPGPTALRSTVSAGTAAAPE